MNYVADRLLEKISSEASKTSARAYVKHMLKSPRPQRMVKRLDETGTFRPSDYGDLARTDYGELARLPSGGEVRRYAHLLPGQRPGDARLVTRAEYVPGSDGVPQLRLTPVEPSQQLRAVRPQVRMLGSTKDRTLR